MPGDAPWREMPGCSKIRLINDPTRFESRQRGDNPPAKRARLAPPPEFWLQAPVAHLEGMSYAGRPRPHARTGLPAEMEFQVLISGSNGSWQYDHGELVALLDSACRGARGTPLEHLSVRPLHRCEGGLQFDLRGDEGSAEAAAAFTSLRSTPVAGAAPGAWAVKDNENLLWECQIRMNLSERTAVEGHGPKPGPGPGMVLNFDGKWHYWRADQTAAGGHGTVLTFKAYSACPRLAMLLLFEWFGGADGGGDAAAVSSFFFTGRCRVLRTKGFPPDGDACWAHVAPLAARLGLRMVRDLRPGETVFLVADAGPFRHAGNEAPRHPDGPPLPDGTPRSGRPVTTIARGTMGGVVELDAAGDALIEFDGCGVELDETHPSGVRKWKAIPHWVPKGDFRLLSYPLRTVDAP